ncbi:hypothetical protein Bca101_009727 [Brassica carinata]
METLGVSGNTLKKGLLEIFASLNEKMKGTAGEGTIQKVFEGYFNRCKKAEDDRHSSKEPFFYLELDVQACSDVYASLDKLVNEGKLFNTLPPLLFFQLNRFNSHCNQEQADKVNQRYEYPCEIHLGKFVTIDADGTDQFTYKLKSVIVHSGGSDCCKIDGYSVKMVDRNRAFEEQYGGDEEIPPLNFTKGSNALMLLYVREDVREAYHESTVRLKKEEGKEVNTAKRSITIKVINIDEDHHGRNKSPPPLLTPHSLIRAKGTLTVAQAVGGRLDLFLRFNRSPGFTGVCELCTIREPRDIEDCF